MILIRNLGLQPYEIVYQEMHNFTNSRNENTKDEIWLVEHLPVFTQGHTGKTEHLLMPINNIPVFKSDRGGQITYHGPGQQIMYILLNLKKRKIRVRKLITILEQTVINTLSEYNIYSYSKVDAPGVYVNTYKICSLGLKIIKGCSLHGIALNVNMDLSPFLYINPCGYVGIKMTQMCKWDLSLTTDIVCHTLVKHFLLNLNN